MLTAEDAAALLRGESVMLDSKDAARLLVAIQRRCDEARQQLSADVQAMVQEAIKEEGYARAVERVLPLNTALTAECEGLESQVEQFDAELSRLRAGILDALQFEVEHNLQRFSPMADRLRALAGLPAEEPPPITEAMAALREIAGPYYDGIDPVAAELRGGGEAERLRAALLLAEEPLALYVESDLCSCEACPECGEMPVECSKTDCSKTCNCSECECCRGERALAEIRALASPYSDGIGPADLAGGDGA